MQITNNKILIISGSYYPELYPRAFRATELSLALSKMGYKVTVMSQLKPFDRLEDDFKNISFIDLGTVLKYSKRKKIKIIDLLYRVINRILQVFLEYPNVKLMFVIYNKLKLANENYDAIISLAMPHPIHWGVALARRNYPNLTKVWIADCGDPFMGQQNDTFKPMFYFKYIEKWVFRIADYITIPTKLAINGYYVEFHEKIKVIPQGFNFNEISKLEINSVKSKIVFGYGGSFIPKMRDPKRFIQFIESLNLDFEFHIYTSTPQFVEPHLSKLNSKVRLFEPLPRKKLLLEFSKMNFVVNFENTGEIQTPSKLIDYAIIGKPILSIPNGQINKEIFFEFINGDYSNAKKIENLDSYKIENVANEFLKLIQYSNSH